MDTPRSIPTEDGAVKYDKCKCRMELIPALPLFDIADVYTYGAKKYAPENWRKGMAWGRIYGAVLRHLFAFWAGNDEDPETGLPHLAHAAFGILTLLEYRRTHPELDDRVKPEHPAYAAGQP